MGAAAPHRRATRFSSIESSQLTGAVFSPDGRWVAYAARETGRQNRVYVEPFPATGTKYQVSNSTEDAHHPVWSPDGTFLFYTPGPGNRMVRVPVAFMPSIAFGVGSSLERPFSNVAGSSDRPYDMWRDGTHFVSISDPVQSDNAPRSMTVVTNWFAELKKSSSR